MGEKQLKLDSYFKLIKFEHCALKRKEDIVSSNAIKFYTHNPTIHIFDDVSCAQLNVYPLKRPALLSSNKVNNGNAENRNLSFVEMIKNYFN